MSKLPINQIIQGDCIEEIAKLPAESVDLIFADPPYNLQLQKDLWRPNRTKVDGVRDEWDQFEGLAAYDAFSKAWLEACRRVLKPTGSLWAIGSYHNIHRVGAIMQNLGYWFLNEITWIKVNPMPNFNGMRFTNAHETLLWVQKQKGEKYTFNYHAMKGLNGEKQMRSDWLLPVCKGRKRIKLDGETVHSTQKPETLLYRVIESSSNPGDVVLDPFFGTGTTGAVAKKMHRNWIGIERDARYVEIARERIEGVKPGDYDELVYTSPNPRRLKRLPFGRLVEIGWVQPGQILFLEKNENVAAQVRADGLLQYNEERGSIHTLARKLKGGPSNGWTMWYYKDDKEELLPLDHLRKEYRSKALEDS